MPRDLAMEGREELAESERDDTVAVSVLLMEAVLPDIAVGRVRETCSIVVRGANRNVEIVSDKKGAAAALTVVSVTVFLPLVGGVTSCSSYLGRNFTDFPQVLATFFSKTGGETEHLGCSD